jgi:histone-lysine N-methyltransferase SETD1
VQYPPPLRSAHLLGHYRLKPLHAVSLLFRTGDDGSLAEAEVDCRCSTMSRPQGAVGFSAFFPAAPKAAREKAKEREKTKSRQLDAPSTRAGITQAVNSNSHVRIDDVTSFPPSVGEHKTPTTSTTQSSTPRLDDNESVQGDILNGVGSASSHASTVSSVFSAPALLSTRTTAEGSKNMNNLTPMTNADSSPNRITSPQEHKLGSQVGLTTDTSSFLHDDPQAQSTLAEHKPMTSRILARDPNRTVKGYKRTYDEHTFAAKGIKKYGKEKEFGLVCIQSAGSVILFV